jgi:hypothetical protein
MHKIQAKDAVVGDKKFFVTTFLWNWLKSPFPSLEGRGLRGG